MKKQLLFLLLILPKMLMAQTDSSKSYLQYNDSLFQYLNKARIGTGVLYDRVYPWADLTLHDAKDTLDYGYLKQAWHELALADYDSSNTKSLEQAMDRDYFNRAEGKGISLGYVNYRFNVIDSMAFADSALYIGADSLVHDGNPALNPYDSFSFTSPIVFADALSGDSVRFFFDPQTKLDNNARQQVQSITLNLAGKPALTLQPGNSGWLNIQGITSAKIVLSGSLQFSNAGTVTVAIGFENGNLVPLSSQSTNLCRSDEVTLWSGSGLAFQGYDESVPAQGQGIYRIFYHLSSLSPSAPCDRHIRKAAIILDGFDPGDERKITKQADKEGIWDRLDYGANKHLGDDLRLQGFDVVVLNFPKYKTFENNTVSRDGGADFIERNAMVLVKLIQNINDSLAANGSAEKIVIVGPSMGGQIARYALAYMEKKQAQGVPNMNHNTRLYVSYDSPHRGANIPIGIQQCLSWLGNHANQADALIKYTVQLRSKAARQMLIEQMDGLNRSASFFTQYYSNNLVNNGTAGSGGWPLNLRKVALINGSQNGVANDAVGSKMMDLRANTSANLKGLELIVRNLNESGSTETFKGLVRQPYSWVPNPPFVGYFGVPTYDITTWPLPNMQKHIRLNATFVGLMGASTMIMNYHGNYNTSNVNPNGVMDIVPGSYYAVVTELKTAFDDQLSKLSAIKNWTWAVANTKQSFMPIISTLAFNNYNFNWNTAVNNRNLVCTGEIPFENYYAPKANEAHITLTEESAEWIKQEILKGQPNCPAICLSSNPNSNSTQQLCVGQSRTFYHNYILPAGATVQWQTGSGLTQNSFNNSSITVTASSSVYSTYVKATIVNPCGANLSVAFNFGTGTAYNISVADVPGDPLSKNLYISNFPSGAQHWWSEDGVNFGSYNTNPYLVSTTPSVLMKTVWLKSQNACGTATIQKVVHFPQQSPMPWGGASDIVAYPNPAMEAWQVVLPEAGATYRLSLYSAEGRLLWEKAQANAGEILVPATTLSSGVYMLKVSGKHKQESLKLVKE